VNIPASPREPNTSTKLGVIGIAETPVFVCESCSFPWWTGAIVIGLLAEFFFGEEWAVGMATGSAGFESAGGDGGLGDC